MVLFVIGNFDIDETLETVKANQAKKSFPTLGITKRKYHFEDHIVHRKHKEIYMSVSAPRVAVGVKYPSFNLSGEEVVKKELAVSILMEEHFGKSSKNYEEMLEKKLINSSYRIATILENHYGYFVVKAETTKVDEFIGYVKGKLLSLKDDVMDEASFKRHKKVVIGEFMRRLNSVEFIANTFIDYLMRDFDLLKVLGVLERITLEDVLEAQSLFVEEAMSTFVIYPKKVSKK